MKEREVRISPQAFQRIQETLIEADVKGHTPDDCARIALVSVGLVPRDGTQITS